MLGWGTLKKCINLDYVNIFSLHNANELNFCMKTRWAQMAILKLFDRKQVVNSCSIVEIRAIVMQPNFCAKQVQTVQRIRNNI